MGNRDDWVQVCNGVLYKGILKDGKPHGKGKVLFLDGDREFYEGMWKKGKRHGYGKIKNVNGCFYDGQWRMDMRHGHGRDWHGDWVYEGQFQEDQRHGHGKYTSWSKDAGGRVVESVVYEGEYKHHNRDGYGKYIIKFGSCVDEYEGDFKQGNLHGKGKYTKTDGRGLVTEYEGDFRRNDLHGNGLMKYPGGVTHEGTWKNGEKHGDILCKHSDGTEVVVLYKKGIRVGYYDRADTRARWQRCIRAVIKELREDKAATERNAVESARQKALRDTIKRNMTAKAMYEAAQRPSTILPGQKHESHRVPREAPDAAANAVRQTEKEANLARLHEQTVARLAQDAANRVRLTERKANIRIGCHINED